MKKGLIWLLVIGGIILIGYFVSKGKFNSMNEAEKEVDQQWSNVEVAYQRRLDLIPNLVNTVKGAAEFEKSTLTAVTEARAGMLSALNSGNAENVDQANQQLSLAMGRLFGYTERYPELKANQNFLALQSQLEGTENRIAVERRKYNGIVKDYNIKVSNFPNNLFASIYGFEEKESFSSAPGSDVAPTVEF